MKLRSRRVQAVPFVLSLLAMARRVDATCPPTEPESITSSLSWVRLQGSEECISAPNLAQAVERRLGRSVFVSPSLGTMAIEGRIEMSGTGHGWRVTISATDHDGHILGSRQLTDVHERCSDVNDALILVVALMINPNASLAPRGSEAPSASPLPSPQPAPVTRIVVQRERVVIHDRPSEPWRADLRAAGMLSAGILPSVVPGISAAFVLESPWFIALEFSGAYLAGATVVNPNEPVQVAFSFAYGAAALCPTYRPGRRVALAACAGAQVGPLRWQTSGLSAPNLATETDVLMVNVTVGARASFLIVGPLFAHAGVSLLLPLVQPHFVYTDSMNGLQATVPLYAVPPIGAIFEVGIGVHFGS